ncbi:MAG: hypothetical protein FWG98_15700 [Candidatus Cloacimonetes bacterium]|nr:hypothetical protein [Candidatus Cloacimonadota bacterium]
MKYSTRASLQNSNYGLATIGGAQGTVGYDKERGSTINRNQPLSLLFYN